MISSGFELISAAYLLVSGDRKLFFYSSKRKAATRRDDDSMQQSKAEEKKKNNTDHVKLKLKQVTCKYNESTKMEADRNKRLSLKRFTQIRATS